MQPVWSTLRRRRTKGRGFLGSVSVLLCLGRTWYRQWGLLPPHFSSDIFVHHALLSTGPQMVLQMNLLVWVRHLFFILLVMLETHLTLTIFRGFNLLMINNWELINYLPCQGLWICAVPILARTLLSSYAYTPLQQIIILRPQLLLCALNNFCSLPLISYENISEQL